jgi:hypothetical protein
MILSSEAPDRKQKHDKTYYRMENIQKDNAKSAARERRNTFANLKAVEIKEVKE